MRLVLVWDLPIIRNKNTTVEDFCPQEKHEKNAYIINIKLFIAFKCKLRKFI